MLGGITVDGNIRVLLIDKEAETRLWLGRLLVRTAGFDLVASLESTAQTDRLPAGLNPRLALVEGHLVRDVGPSWVPSIRQRWPGVFIALTCLDHSNGYLRLARSLGADGAFYKLGAPEELKRLRNLLAGPTEGTGNNPTLTPEESHESI